MRLRAAVLACSAACLSAASPTIAPSQIALDVARGDRAEGAALVAPSAVSAQKVQLWIASDRETVVVDPELEWIIVVDEVLRALTRLFCLEEPRVSSLTCITFGASDEPP